MLGAKRFWVYPAKVDGFWQRVHRYSGAVLISILVGIPWIRIGGQPLLLFDLPVRRFFLGGLVFTPRDSFLLFLFLITAGFTLFFVTAMFGRLWCGFACPQTVLLEEFIRRIELVIEGDRGKRRKRDEGPWTADKALRKAAKWIVFAAIAIVIAFSLMGFFDSIYDIWTLKAGKATYAFAAAFAFVLFLDFAWFREQFCIYLCPYARFQGAMTDEHSLIIGYDGPRGEPRLNKEALKAGTPKSDFGDCVGCNRCVTVCPTGIDIRDGFQLECISCARCIDACTEVLGKRNKETLVRFASEASMQGKKAKPFRARTFIYGAINTVAAVTALVMILMRPAFDLAVAPVRNTLTGVTTSGMVQNRYELTLSNNTMHEKDFTFEIEGIEGGEIVVPGNVVVVPAADRLTLQVFILAPPESVSGGVVSFTVVGRSEDRTIRRRATFRYFAGDSHASLANPGVSASRSGGSGEHAAALSRADARGPDRSQL